MGQLHLRSKELEPAERYFHECLTLASRLASRTEDADHLNEMANQHNGLGAVAKGRKDYAQAARHFQLSVELNRRAVAAQPDEKKYIGGLANSLSWLGDMRLRLGHHAEATRHFVEESALLEGLRRRAPDELLWTNRLVYALWHQANAELDEGKRNAALASYVRARELMSGLAKQDPSNQDWQIDVIRLRLRELEMQPMTQRLLRALEDLENQGIAMSTAEPENPELGRLVEQLRDSLAGARSLISSRQAK